MRPGILEIFIILIVLVAIIIFARMFRANPDSAKQSRNASREIITRQVNERTPRLRSYLRRAGIAFIVAGVVLLLAGISMFRWAVQSYLWASVIIVIGLAVVYLSRKR